MRDLDVKPTPSRDLDIKRDYQLTPWYLNPRMMKNRNSLNKLYLSLR